MRESIGPEGSQRVLALAATLFALSGCNDNHRIENELKTPFTGEELIGVCGEEADKDNLCLKACEEKGTAEEHFCRRVNMGCKYASGECQIYGAEVRKKCLAELQKGQIPEPLPPNLLHELCRARVGRILASRQTQLTPSYMLSQCETGHSTHARRKK